MDSDLSLSDLETLLEAKLGITERDAQRIQAEIHIIAAHKARGVYDGGEPCGFLLAAYDALARILVHAKTPPKMLEETIPKLVDYFRTINFWPPDNPETCYELLRPAIEEWHGKAALMRHEHGEQGAKDKPQSTADQLNRLRQECRWTVCVRPTPHLT